MNTAKSKAIREVAIREAMEGIARAISLRATQSRESSEDTSLSLTYRAQRLVEADAYANAAFIARNWRKLDGKLT